MEVSSMALQLGSDKLQGCTGGRWLPEELALKFERFNGHAFKLK